MASNTVKTILVKAKDQASGTFKKLKGLYDQNRNSLVQMGNAIGGVSNASLTLIAASQQNDAQMAANGMTMMANTLGLGGVATATRGLFAATGEMTTAVTDAVTWGQNLFNGLVGNQTQMTSYTGTVQALQPQLQAMGVDTQNATAMLAALEAQGITGSAATDMFTSAVTLASASGRGLTDILGITQEQMAMYDSAMTQSTGMTNTFTNAANTQFGMIDSLKNLWGDFGQKVGDTIAPFQGVFEKVGMVHGAITDVGPIVTDLKDRFFDAKDALQSVRDVGGKVIEKASALKDKLPGLGSKFADLGKSAFKAVGGLIASAAAKVWSWASAIPLGLGIPLGIAAVAAITASIFAIKSRMSGFADGGIAYKPMVANLAEREPEVIAPFSKVESVFGGGRNITIPIYLDGRRIANYVVDTVSKQAKLQGAY